MADYVCAACGKGTALWQGITVAGWRGIKVYEFEGEIRAEYDGSRDVTGPDEDQHEFGCGECGAEWYRLAEGVRRGIRDCPKCEGAGCPRCGYAGKVDIDEPPVPIHPEQQRFADRG